MPLIPNRSRLPFAAALLALPLAACHEHMAGEPTRVAGHLTSIKDSAPVPHARPAAVERGAMRPAKAATANEKASVPAMKAAMTAPATKVAAVAAEPATTTPMPKPKVVAAPPAMPAAAVKRVEASAQPPVVTPAKAPVQQAVAVPAPIVTEPKPEPTKAAASVTPVTAPAPTKAAPFVVMAPPADPKPAPAAVLPSVVNAAAAASKDNTQAPSATPLRAQRQVEQVRAAEPVAVPAAVPAPAIQPKVAAAPVTTAPLKATGVAAPIAQEKATELLEGAALLLKVGNVAGARAKLTEAMRGQSAGAVERLAASYDPVALKGLPVPAGSADPAKATRYYIQAIADGSPTAKAQLEAMREFVAKARAAKQ